QPLGVELSLCGVAGLDGRLGEGDLLRPVAEEGDVLGRLEVVGQMVAGIVEEVLRQWRPFAGIPWLRVDDGDRLTALVQLPGRCGSGQTRTDDDDPLAHVSHASARTGHSLAEGRLGSWRVAVAGGDRVGNPARQRGARGELRSPRAPPRVAPVAAGRHDHRATSTPSTWPSGQL